MMHMVDIVSDGTQGDVVFRWAVLLIGQGIIFTGMILGYLSTKGKVDGVKDQATLAAELAAPTGNGFAKRTEAALERIEKSIDKVEEKVDRHIQDHASNSFKKD